MNSCFNSCCNCSKDHYYIGPTGCTGTIGPNGATCPQSIQGIQGKKGETGPAWSIAIPTCRLNWKSWWFTWWNILPYEKYKYCRNGFILSTSCRINYTNAFFSDYNLYIWYWNTPYRFKLKLQASKTLQMLEFQM